MTAMLTRLMGWMACACAVVLLVVAMVSGTAGPAVAGVAQVMPRVSHAWVRLAVVPGRPAAGYFTVTSATADTLTGITSPQARVEMHAMDTAGGVMRMTPLRTVVVGVKPVVFAPGASHLMLFGLTAARPGSTVPLVFAFAHGGTVRVDAAVRAAGDETMPAMTM